MKKGSLVGGALAVVALLLAGLGALRACRPDSRSEIGQMARNAVGQGVRKVEGPGTGAEESAHASLLYGRVRTYEGGTYEGRLRWGGGEEAFWGDAFNGVKKNNPWAAHVPAGKLPMERRSWEVFGFELFPRLIPANLRRPLLVRFGDMARIAASGRQVLVTLKSGTVFELDRFEASDFDDGLRVWDGREGAVDLDSLRIREIELMAAPRPGGAPDRLHGTVRTRGGESFTGFLQWNRTESLGGDEVSGEAEGGERSVRFDAIRAMERRGDESVEVMLVDGGSLVLRGGRAAGDGFRGIYVDDARYGRVLVSWGAFARVGFSRSGSGPAYGDYAPGRALRGSVTTRDGRLLAGRLVFDLDESEVTETLDAPWRGVTYMIPFEQIAWIALPEGRGPARVKLAGGEELPLERVGDLGPGHAGMLVFGEGGGRAEYVPWEGVARIELAGRAAPATGAVE